MSLRIYRRDLPHLRLDGATYWVTWNLRRRQSPLRPAERAIVASTIRHFDGVQFDLHAFVVMDDHVHVVVTTTPGVALEAIVHSWKSFSAWRLQREEGRPGALWQEECYDRIVRDDQELTQKVSYVLNNPRRRWPGIIRYEWAWARGMEAEDG